MLRRPFLAALVASALLGGCDMLGIESPEKVAAARDADGKAVGGACRHAGRAIEDCYALYRKADRAAVFAGWRDMNDYMRENKIDAVPPELTPGPGKGGEKPTEKAVETDKSEKAEKPPDKPEKAEKADKADKAKKPAEKPAAKAAEP